MRATHYAGGTGGSVTAEAKKLVAAIGLLGGVFALLVAASYPGLVAAATTGAVSAAVAGRGARRVRKTGGVCVPGTDVCLRVAT